jgi:hypothetical protein
VAFLPEKGTQLNATKSRKPPQPVTGSCRWVLQPGRTGTPGLLVISARRADGRAASETYTLTEHRDGGRLVGYRLAKPDGTAYDLVPGEGVWECDCPDYTFNRATATTPAARECKHCRATRRALAELA